LLSTEEVDASLIISADNDTLSEGMVPPIMEDGIAGEEIPIGEMPSVPALDITYLRDRPIIIT